MLRYWTWGLRQLDPMWAKLRIYDTDDEAQIERIRIARMNGGAGRRQQKKAGQSPAFFLAAVAAPAINLILEEEASQLIRTRRVT